MHVFISAGEPSGDIHGAGLIRALRRLHPDLRVAGFGGDRMEAAGCGLLYPLCRTAVMWFLGVFARLPQFLRLLAGARRYFERERPDAVVLIDYPGFNFALAERAKRAGIPVFYFVPPQMWAWGGWRVKKAHRLVDRVLATLPFESEWYARRGVGVDYVGHPYFDELAAQRSDAAFVAEQARGGGPVVALLPGSRMQEVRRNFPTMLKSAALVAAATPGVRFLVAAFNEEQAAVARGLAAGTGLPLEVHVGRTPEIIEAATACVSVSGSVSLELMNRMTPTVIVYRIGRVGALLKRVLLRCRFITLVNLLADDELYPEFVTTGDPSAEVAATVRAWLEVPELREGLRERLRRLRDRVALPGACDRAARVIDRMVGGRGEGETRTAA